MGDTPKKRYTTDYLLRPGMTFEVDIEDSKQRVQAYLDSSKSELKVEVSFHFPRSCPSSIYLLLYQEGRKLSKSVGKPRIMVIDVSRVSTRHS
jgi:hypothetical protein